MEVMAAMFIDKALELTKKNKVVIGFDLWNDFSQISYASSCILIPTIISFNRSKRPSWCIHYILDDFGDEKLDFRSQEEKQTSAEHYEIQEMREMYEGIYVSAFQLFHGEALQYYITETYAEEGAGVQEPAAAGSPKNPDFQRHILK